MCQEFQGDMGILQWEFYSGPLESWNPESKFGDVVIGPSDASHALVDGCHVVMDNEGIDTCSAKSEQVAPPLYTSSINWV